MRSVYEPKRLAVCRAPSVLSPLNAPLIEDWVSSSELDEGVRNGS